MQIHPVSEDKAEDVIVILGLMSFMAGRLLSSKQVSLNLTGSHVKNASSVRYADKLPLKFIPKSYSCS